MIHKTFSARVNKSDSYAGEVQALVSVTGNKDRQGDVIRAGAFRDVIASGKKPPVVWGHQWQDLGSVLGRVKSWTELMPGDSRLPDDILAKDYGGLLVDMKFNLGTEGGKTAFSLLKSSTTTRRRRGS